VAALGLQAQVVIEGEVRNGSDVLQDVTIQVLENNKVIRTIAANRKGQFETAIPFGKEYTLTFRKAFMYPISISVNTSIDKAKTTGKSYVVPLNMQMFYRFQGMDGRPTRNPIGLIKQTGTGTETFSFVPDQKVIKQLKVLQKESTARYERGEQPIDKEVNERGKTEIAAPEVKPDSESVEEVNDTPDRIDALVERNDIIKEAQKIERETEKQSEEVRQSVSETKGDETDDFIVASKRIRTEALEEKRERQDQLSDAKIEKDKSLYPSMNQGYRAGTDAPSMVLIKSSLDDGWILDEESMWVDQGGVIYTYEKETYDLGFMVVTYFYKDNEEITEEQYESIKDELGL